MKIKNIQVINKKEYQLFVLIIVVYVFFNSVLLPPGFQYTMVLSPLMLIILFRKNDKFFILTLFYYLLISSLLIMIHSANTINISYYLTSFTIFTMCLIFYSYSRQFTLRYWPNFEYVVTVVSKLNIILVIVAIIALMFDIGTDIFWFKNEITATLGFKRLRLLTYESSYYSILLVPFFFYYFQHYFFKTLTKARLFLFFSIIFSLLLSLSYGTIGAIVASLILSTLLNFVFQRRKKFNQRFVTISIILGSTLITSLLLFWSDSGIMVRIFNIINGSDTSVNGRLIDSYTIALKVLDQQKSFWFGIGPGQFKVFGANIVNEFYGYTLSDNYDISRTVRLPCANAETLVTYGVIGLVFRLSIEIYLFHITGVFQSSYRLSLFLFMFLTQFAGSNLANLPEYFIWALCFAPNTFYDQFFINSKKFANINSNK